MNQLNNVKKAFDLFANQYSDQYIDLDLYNDTLEMFCKLIGNGEASLLELACGPGNISKNLLTIKKDLNILGIDISPKMIELACQNVPSATFLVEDVMNIGTLNRKFDAVLSGFCYPYLDQDQVFKNIGLVADCLYTGGQFYISTISGNYQDSQLKHSSSGEGDPIFNYLYNHEILEVMLKQHNFEIHHRMYKERVEKNDNIAEDIILISSLKK